MKENNMEYYTDRELAEKHHNNRMTPQGASMFYMLETNKED